MWLISSMLRASCWSFFFFQAEDGIRDLTVTGVQTCALPISFVELGVKPGDRVGLFSANRSEWHTADFAINGAGAVTVPVYFNESPDRMTYKIGRASCRERV